MCRNSRNPQRTLSISTHFQQLESSQFSWTHHPASKIVPLHTYVSLGESTHPLFSSSHPFSPSPPAWTVVTSIVNFGCTFMRSYFSTHLSHVLSKSTALYLPLMKNCPCLPPASWPSVSTPSRHYIPYSNTHIWKPGPIYFPALINRKCPYSQSNGFQ